MSRYVRMQTETESECGGFQWVATSFVFVLFFYCCKSIKQLRPKFDLCSGSTRQLDLNIPERSEATIFQNLATGAHSQNTWPPSTCVHVGSSKKHEDIFLAIFCRIDIRVFLKQTSYFSLNEVVFASKPNQTINTTLSPNGQNSCSTATCCRNDY